MGWQDAPLVEASAATPKWQQAPEVKGSLPAVLDYSPVAGAVEAGANLVTGAAGASAGGLAGIGQAATNALGLTTTPAADRVAQVQGAMTYEPGTKAGRAITGAVSLPFELLAKGADRAGEAVANAIPNSPRFPIPGAAVGAGVNTAIQALPMAISPAARAIPGESAAAIAARAKAQALAKPVDDGVAAAREAGLKVTPTQAGAGVVNRAVESLAGTARLEKGLSRKNAPVINDLIRKDVGLADDVPLSQESLAQVRKDAGSTYEAIKSAGRFETDAQYKADLYAINKGHDTAAKDFSHRSENPFKKTMDGLNVDAMDAASAVEEVKLLRLDADKAYRAGDKHLGASYKSAAQALDNQIDRSLKATDPQMADAVAKYRAARVQIAKSYAAEEALNEATGNIDASKYAKALKAGGKLTGGAETVGKFAQQFPKAAQRVEPSGSTGPTYFDLLLGGSAGILGTATGGAPGAAALALGASRPAARSLMMTGPYQNMITKPRTYGRPVTRSLQELLQEAGMSGGAVGTAAGQQ